MIKYYARLQFGSSTMFSFRVERETARRYYITKASVKHLHGTWGGHQKYIPRGSPHLYDTAKEALEHLIASAAEAARGTYRVYQEAKAVEEGLTALRGREPFA
jgi:hypothetical protein